MRHKPAGAAIAEAIRRLRADPLLADPFVGGKADVDHHCAVHTLRKALQIADKALTAAVAQQRAGELRELDLLGPLDWRGQHAALEGQPIATVERSARSIIDARGETGDPFQVNDTLSAMQRAGTISEGLYAAGRDFAHWFNIAQLDPLRAADLSRIPGVGSHEDARNAVARARREIRHCLELLGGPASEGGRAAYQILGEGKSIRRFCADSVISGKWRIKREAAQGVLVTVLAVLAKYMRYETEPRPKPKPKTRRKADPGRERRSAIPVSEIGPPIKFPAVPIDHGGTLAAPAPASARHQADAARLARLEKAAHETPKRKQKKRRKH